MTKLSMVPVLASAAAWGALWGVSVWYFGKYETGKQFDFFIGIPLILPACLAAWATIRFFFTARRMALAWAIFGLLVGTILGGLGTVVFLNSLQMGAEAKYGSPPPNLEVPVALGGVVAGIITGALVELVRTVAPGLFEPTDPTSD